MGLASHCLNNTVAMTVEMFMPANEAILHWTGVSDVPERVAGCGRDALDNIKPTLPDAANKLER